MALVESVAEMLDSAVLGFLALAEGQTPLERLDELSERTRLPARAGAHRQATSCCTPLGTGGMAQVMVARTRGAGRACRGWWRSSASSRNWRRTQAIVEQFLDEAKLGLRLSHPNLVTFYDFGQAAGGATSSRWSWCAGSTSTTSSTGRTGR